MRQAAHRVVALGQLAIVRCPFEVDRAGGVLGYLAAEDVVGGGSGHADTLVADFPEVAVQSLPMDDWSGSFANSSKKTGALRKDRRGGKSCVAKN